MKPVGGAKAWGGFPGYVGLFEDNHEWSKGRTQGRWSDPPLDPSDRLPAPSKRAVKDLGFGSSCEFTTQFSLTAKTWGSAGGLGLKGTGERRWGSQLACHQSLFDCWPFRGAIQAGFVAGTVGTIALYLQSWGETKKALRLPILWKPNIWEPGFWIRHSGSGVFKPYRSNNAAIILQWTFNVCSLSFFSSLWI